MLVCAFAQASAAAAAADTSPPAGVLRWERLPDLPDPVGFAAPFAGVSGDALIVAGGANFPDAPLWQGGKKRWHDRAFVLDDPKGPWKPAGTLPRPLGYGVSVTTRGGVVCAGGSDADRHYADVFRLTWAEGRLAVTPLPPLPRPCANACGALLGDTLYVAGGAESPDATAAMRTFWALDLSKAEPAWRELEPWPGAARMLAVAGVADGSFFLFGGAGLSPGAGGKPRRTFLTDGYRFTPGRGWRRVADLPRPAVAAPSPALTVGAAHLLVLTGDDGANVDFQPLDRHPGFPRDAFLYHAVTDTWVPAGEVPFSRATAPVIAWRGRCVVPSGEVRPGVRTPEIWAAAPSADKPDFGWANYATLGVYPVLMLGIALAVGKKESSDEFFRGGQRIPWWAAGLSIFATMLSSITFMSLPAKAYATDWAFALTNLSVLVVAALVIWVYLPFFRQLNVTSAYEYLERRFNLAARWFGSASFILFQIGRTAIVLYLPALALATVSRFDEVTCILVMGVICILMTFVGGIEAVVWTDVAQTLILLAGAAVSLAYVLTHVPGGAGEAVRVASAHGKFFEDLSWSSSTSIATGWVVLVGGLLSNTLIPYTTSQDVIQRYMSTRTERQAARAIWTNALLTIPATVLFFAVGTGLFVFYKSFPTHLDPRLAKTDGIFPLFMVRELPAGVGGLVVAAQPTSSLNSIATAFVTDFYRRLDPDANDASSLRLARAVTVAAGVAGTAVALLMTRFPIASLWDVFLGVLGLTGGALAGLFALGIFTRRASGAGAMVGAVVSMMVLFVVQRTTDVHLLLYGAVGVVTCFVVGYVASIVLPERRKALDGLTLQVARRG